MNLGNSRVTLTRRGAKSRGNQALLDLKVIDSSIELARFKRFSGFQGHTPPLIGSGALPSA